MKKQLFLLVILLFFVVFRYIKQGESDTIKTDIKKPNVTKVIDIANSYLGVSYRAGGATRKGMDCSGLVNTSFKQIGIQLPRSSSAMSTQGTKVSLDLVQPGDLLFFDISSLDGGINHVGLVTMIKDDEVFFIHSTTSQGVIVSSMNEIYWKGEFVVAKRFFY
ncbi:C40 family peptidase [Tenacibaculum crassostreae]|uniref:C40 family peptidase n=1 Tax=Tenacibaculum crassostreae TaxID=502683 RepID=UPI003894FB84